MMKSSRFDLLLSPYFFLSLCLLVLNDHIFKVAWPQNIIVGKLSDFTGLAAFFYFVRACLGLRKSTAYLCIGVSFVLWKSFLFDLPLGLWNSFSPLILGREKDLSDLIALSILPLAEIHFQKRLRQASTKRNVELGYLVAALSCFAFGATSQVRIPELAQFNTPEEAQEFQRQLARRKHFDFDKSFVTNFPLPIDRTLYAEKLREKGFLIDESICVDCHFQGWFYHTFNIRAVRGDFLDASLRNRKSWPVVSDEACPLVGSFHVELTVENEGEGSLVKIRNADFCTTAESLSLEAAKVTLEDLLITPFK